MELSSRFFQIIGTAHLAFPWQPNGNHRAEVQKVLVHTCARKRGLGTALMVAIEAEARAIGRSLLFLDTERTSAGERLYEKVGYTRVGVIPKYALNFDGSELIDTVVYYKILK